MTIDSKSRRRAGPSLVLVLVPLLVVLTVLVSAGVAFLVVRREAVDRPAAPLSDEQSMAQVLEPAREIVAVAQLDSAAGSYILMSCNNETDPPYQGAIYLTFDLPTAAGYFDRVAAELVSHGWHKASQPYNYLPGTTVSKDGVTAVLYRDPDHGGSGIMKVYGECRNVVDHRNDPTGWVDITGQLR